MAFFQYFIGNDLICSDHSVAAEKSDLLINKYLLRANYLQALWGFGSEKKRHLVPPSGSWHSGEQRGDKNEWHMSNHVTWGHIKCRK